MEEDMKKAIKKNGENGMSAIIDDLHELKDMLFEGVEGYADMEEHVSKIIKKAKKLKPKLIPICPF